MKYKINETSIDAAYNVAINGVYMDGTTQVGGEAVFQFDLATTPHANKTEFLAAVKKVVEASQPGLSPEELEKKALAETAKALLDSYVGTSVTLAPPVTE